MLYENTLRNPITLLLLTMFLAIGSLQAQVGALVYLPQEEESGNSTHTVRAGETLYAISKKYDISVDKLKSLNNLRNNTIWPGQTLKVETPVTRSAVARTANTESQERYTGTQSGKTLSSLLENTPSYTSTSTYDDPLETDSYLVQRMRTTSDDASRYRETRVEKRTYHEVRKGDDLFSIADAYGVTPDELREWNAITRVYPGQTIVVGKKYQDADLNVLREDETMRTSERARSARMQWEQSRNYSSYDKSDSYRDNNQYNNNQYNSNQYNTNQRNRQPELLYEQSRDVNSRSSSYSNPDIYKTQDNRSSQNTRSYSPNTSTPDNTARTSYNNTYRKQMETGKYREYKIDPMMERRFYALHKTLPPGSKFKMLIPNNPGFVEVEVVGRLSPGHPIMVGLSPACVSIIEGAGGGDEVSIIYE